MKNSRITILFILAFCFAVVISCSDDDGLNSGVKGRTILPESFRVDIPDAISDISNKKSKTSDDLKGGEIYEMLRVFIFIGEESSKLVEDIITAINTHEINGALSFSYPSDDDGRAKNIVVEETADFEGKTWEFQLTITDADSEGEADGGKAMQVFWNTEPVEGISIMKPYNIDRKHDENMGDAMYRIDYSEAGNNGYEAEMTVYISNFPDESNGTDPYALSSLKMFAGKKGDVVDVYGNSNHPAAQLNPLSDDFIGFNWAFVASGDKVKDIGVAEVGLPGSESTMSSRQEILEDNSLYSVMSREITNYIKQKDSLTLSDDIIAAYLEPYLEDAKAPGYFDSNGFVTSGESPSEDYSPLIENINLLTPFVPAEISDLQVEFKE